jgi:hypothetical protein
MRMASSATKLADANRNTIAEVQRGWFANALCGGHRARCRKRRAIGAGYPTAHSASVFAYWGEKAILDGTWKPPVITLMQGAASVLKTANTDEYL